MKALIDSMDPYYVLKPVHVPLHSNFISSLYETSHGNIVEVKKYRPNSVSTIYQHAREPIRPKSQPLGTETKSR